MSYIPSAKARGFTAHLVTAYYRSYIVGNTMIYDIACRFLYIVINAVVAFSRQVVNLLRHMKTLSSSNALQFCFAFIPIAVD